MKLDAKLVNKAFFDTLKELSREKPDEAIDVWIGIGLAILEALPKGAVTERDLILDAVCTYEPVLALRQILRGRTKGNPN